MSKLETVQAAAIVGIRVHRVRVEVAIRRSTPSIQVVGLAASAVREGRQRIRAATSRVGVPVPGLGITVNLAPADMRKDGSAFDLPITAGILAADGQIPPMRLRRYALVGELGLDGSLRPVRGALPVALHFQEAEDVEGLILPRANLAETRPADGTDVRGAAGLREVLDFLCGRGDLPSARELEPADEAPVDGAEDLADVRGQARAKRALTVAAAGGHNLLLRGEPGAGKTMLARRLPGLLPGLSPREAVEVTAVHSVAGRLADGGDIIRRPPFRAPHHTVSVAGLAGGGAVPRPGEVSLAHRGVLFLDEMPLYSRQALEVLRQPLEERRITVVRARTTATFPADFTLVAAMNPCPCGYATSRDDRCTCQPPQVARYLRRVSGPLLDRIDLQVEVPAVEWEELRDERSGLTSTAARARVREARTRAARRLVPDLRRNGGSGSSGDRRRSTNAEMTADELHRHCALGPEAEALVRRGVEEHGLTARGYHRLLRVARTVADLEGAEQIAALHVAEAIQYRLPARGPRR